MDDHNLGVLFSTVNRPGAGLYPMSQSILLEIPAELAASSLGFRLCTSACNGRGHNGTRIQRSVSGHVARVPGRVGLALRPVCMGLRYHWRMKPHA